MHHSTFSIPRQKVVKSLQLMNLKRSTCFKSFNFFDSVCEISLFIAADRKWVLNCIKKWSFVSFQIEENTKQMYADSQGQHSSAVSDPRRRSSGWKVGARNGLLQWCKEIITPKFGIHVENFGSSWRDGRAFVALISALNPGKYVWSSDLTRSNIC